MYKHIYTGCEIPSVNLSSTTLTQSDPTKAVDGLLAAPSSKAALIMLESTSNASSSKKHTSSNSTKRRTTQLPTDIQPSAGLEVKAEGLDKEVSPTFSLMPSASSPSACRDCGAALQSGKRFCSNCGCMLGELSFTTAALDVNGERGRGTNETTSSAVTSISVSTTSMDGSLPQLSPTPYSPSSSQPRTSSYRGRQSTTDGSVGETLFAENEQEPPPTTPSCGTSGKDIGGVNDDLINGDKLGAGGDGDCSELLGGVRKGRPQPLWFHETTDRECAQLLERPGFYNGSFLVRQSASQKGDFVLVLLFEVVNKRGNECKKEGTIKEHYDTNDCMPLL